MLFAVLGRVRPLLLFSFSALIAFGAVDAHAANVFWNGAAGTGSWSNNANWGGSAASGNAVNFTSTITQLTTNDIAAGSFTGILFGASSGAWTLGGNSMAINGNIDSATTNAVTQTINMDLALAKATTQFNVNGTATMLINGRLSGAVAVSVNSADTGTLVLAGSNSFTGALTLGNGVLRIANKDALGTTAGSTTISAGALELSNNIIVAAEGLNLNGTGISNGGALRNISGDNTYSGNITNVTAARINSDVGTLTLDVATGNALSIGTVGVTFGGAGNILVNDAIAGTTGTLTKDGAGTLTLSATNGYTGLTTVNGGTLSYGISNALSTGGVTVNSNAVLDVGGFSDTVGAVTLADGSITGTTGVLSGSSYAVTNGSISAILGGAGALTKGGAGTVTLSGANTYSGGTALNGGVLSLGNSGALGSSGTISFGGGTLQYGASNSTDYSARFSTAASQAISIDTGGQGVTFATALTSSGGSLTKLGTGTLTLTAANSYTGATTIANGTLALSGSGLISTNTITLANSGAVLDLSGATANSFTNASLTGAAGSSLLFSNKNLTIGGANTSTTFSGTLSGNSSSTLTKVGTGTLTLAGDNNFSGGLLISAGGLAGTTANLSMPLTNNATLIFDQSTNGSYSSALSGTGALAKLGTGTVTLGNANTYGGTTTIGGGAFSVGTLANAGSSSSIGTNGTIIITNGGVLDYTGSTVSINRGISLAAGAGGLSVSGASTALTISGVISNTGSLLKDGAGTLILAGANTYSGGTTITNGTLALSNSGALAAAGTINLASSGAAFDISGITPAGFTNSASLTGVSGSSIVLGSKNLVLTNTGVATLGSAISGSGSFTKAGLGTLTLSGASTSYTGAATVSAGLLEIQNASALGTGAAGTTVTSGATLALSGNITNTTEAVTVGGAGVGSLGALRNLSGDNTLSGGATLSAATTIGSDAGTLTLGNINAANFALTFTNTGNTVVAGAITNSTSTLTANGTGTLTLSGANTFSGGTTVNAGSTVVVQNGGALGSGAGGTTVASGGEIQVAGNVTVAENISSIRGTGVGGDGALYNSSGTNTWSGWILLNNTTTIGAAADSQLIFSGIFSNATKALTVSNQGTVAINSFFGKNTTTKLGSGSLVLGGSNNFGTGGILLVGDGVVSLQSSNSVAGTPVITMSNGTTLELTGGIDVAPAAVTINGTGFNNTGVIRNTSGDNIYRGTVTLGSASTIISESGSLTFANTIGGNFAKTFDGAGNITASGAVGGTAVGITKNGTGTLTLTAANGYTGATTISGGAVNVRNATGLGTTAGGTTVDSGAALELQGGITVGAEALTLSGTGIGGGGALRNIIGFNTYGGTITNLSAARINSDVNTLTLSGGINGNNQALTFGGTGDITVTGAITNSTAGLTKDGNGVLTLSATNTYTGTTTVSAGTLAYGVSNAISTGAVTVSGGTLSMGAFSDAVGAVTLTSGSITGSTGVLTGSSYAVEGGSISAILGGSGALTKSTAGTVTLSGANTYTGATSISAGTLAISTTAALASSSGVSLGNSAELQYTGANGTLDRAISVTNGTGTIRNTGSGTLTLSGSLAKDGTVLRFNSGTFNITGVISGASANSDLIVDNATVTLSNANTYNGPTYIRNAGVLNANVVGALPTNTRTALTLDDTGSGGSKLSLGANQVVASLAGADSSLVTLGANTLTVGTTSGSTTFAGVMSGTGRLVKDGASTQILTGSNTLSGPITISAGTLQVGAGTDAGSIASVSSISNNGVLSYQIGNGTRTLAAPISGTGSLALDSPGGVLNVNGSNSYSGGTTITAGELHAFTNSSVGTGAVTLTGTNPAYLAQLHYSNTASPLSVGALSLNGNAAIDLQPGTSMASTGVVSITSTNNFISIGGNTWNTGTNTLVSGTSLSFGGGANIYLSGSAVANAQVALGTTGTNGRTSYAFNTNATSFYVVVNGVSFDLVWSGAANSQWNTNSANWQQSTMGTNPSGTNITFVNSDDVYFGNAATSNAITVASGVQADNIYVTNTSGTVTFNGSQLYGHTLTKSGAGDLAVSNTLVLIGNDVGLTNGALLNSGGGNVTLSGNFTQGQLIQAGTGTTTLAASNSFSGGVVASNGVVSATANNALGSGNLEVSGGTVNIGSTAQSLNLITLNSGSITGTGSLTSSNALQAKDGTISAVIAGSGGVTKSTAGTVTLSGANTYTGLTHVTGGTLSVGADNNLGNATNGLHMQGGTLQTTGSFATGRDVTMTTSGTFETASGTGLQLTGTITGGGALAKAGNGTLTLSGNNSSFSGTTSLDAGTLRLGSATAAGTGALTQGAGTKLEIDTTGMIANSMTLRDVSFLQSATLSGGLTLDTATFAVSTNLTGTLSGVVGGTGGLAKTGTGTLVLDNANTFTGGILISDGSLKVLKAGALSSGNITNNATLEIAVPTSVATNGVNISNTISGTGSLVRTGVTGQGISLTGSGDNTYTGLTIVNSGTLRFDKSGGAQAVGGDVVVNGGALIISGNEQIPDAKTVTVNAGTFDFSPNATPGRSETLATFTKLGGTLRTYGNTLNVTNFNISGAGTNWINANANDGTAGSIVVLAGGTGLTLSGNDSPTITIGSAASGTANSLVLNADVTANVTNGTAQILSASISGSGTNVAGVVNLGGGTRAFNVSDGSAATDMLVSASMVNGGLNKTGEGRLTLSGSNSYTGGTLVSAGTLAGDTTSLQGAITNNAAVVFDQTTSGTYAGALSGTGSLTKLGAGTVTLTASNTYSGTTTIGGGVLMADTLANGGSASSIGSGSAVILTNNGVLRYTGASASTDRNIDLAGNGGIGVSNSAAALSISGVISNTGSLSKYGAGTLILSGANTYLGGTTLSAGTLRLGSATAAGAGTITQTDGSSTLTIDTTGTVANAMSIYNISTLQTVTLSGAKTLNNTTYNVTNNTTTTETGLLSGSGGVTKEGAGTLVLAGSANNTYTGATDVNAGALVLSNSAGNAINNSSGITVNSGTSLILGASNQIGDSIGLTLNGGTFIVGNATAGYSETLGTLTLSASSTIDLGSYSTGLRTLTFADSSAITWSTNAVLTITNWQGINRQSSDVAEILFGVGGLTSTQLGQIYFANQDMNGGMLVGGSGELVPVPEAKVVWGAISIALAVGWRERRRLSSVGRRWGIFNRR